MKKETLLGRVVQKIADLSVEILGAVYDLIEKLSGEASQEWLDELKKFLKKENCWTGVVKETILRLISGGQELLLDTVDGSRILANAKDTFVYIDPDLVRWGTNEQGLETPETPIEVHEMVKDSTFAQMFGSLNSDVKMLCLTQHQILNFIRKYRDWLRTEGFGTFFLFKSNGHFFVARVDVGSDGRLHVDVRRFGDDDVWLADDRHRVILPQLA